MLGDHFKQKTKAQKYKLMGLIRLQKAQKQDGKASLCSTPAGNVFVGQLKIFTTVCMSANDHKNSMNIDLGAKNKFWDVGKFANTESVDNEDQMYFEFQLFHQSEWVCMGKSSINMAKSVYSLLLRG